MGLQDIYRDEMVVARAGQIADCAFNDVITRINDDPSALQVDTIVIDTATNSYTYTVTVEGVAISYTSDASATKVEIAAGLAAALNAESLTNGRYNAVSDGVDTITVTARYRGVGWTMTESEAKITLTHTTANATADEVPFGVGLIYDSDNAEYARLPKAASLAKKVVTLTPVVANSTPYPVDIEINGITYSTTYTSDADATAKEIVEGAVALINAAMPANTVVATEDDAAITLTAEVEGLSFNVIPSETIWTLAETTVTGLTDIRRAFVGVSARDNAQETNSSNVTQYAAGSAMNVLRRGRIWVTTETTVSLGDRVYMRIDGTGQAGAFTNSPTATEHLELSPSVARWVEVSSSTLAKLELDAR